MEFENTNPYEGPVYFHSVPHRYKPKHWWLNDQLNGWQVQVFWMCIWGVMRAD